MPAIEHHLNELAVVLVRLSTGRHLRGTGASARMGWWSRLLLQQSIYAAILRRHARLLRSRHGVRGIHHAQRFEDVLLVVGFERHSP